MSSKTFTGRASPVFAMRTSVRMLIGLVVERHDLLLRGRLGVEARAAAVERRLGHVLHHAFEVVAVDAGARERGDVEVAVERLELLDQPLARRLVGVLL